MVRRATRMMGGLTQHGAEFDGAMLGDMAVPVTVAGLKSARYQAGIAGHVLGTGEPLDIREEGERGQATTGPTPGTASSRRISLRSGRARSAPPPPSDA